MSRARHLGRVWVCSWLFIFASSAADAMAAGATNLDWADWFGAIRIRCERESNAAYDMQAEMTLVVDAWRSYLPCIQRMLESHLNLEARKLETVLLRESLPDRCIPNDATDPRDLDNRATRALAYFKDLSSQKRAFLGELDIQLRSRNLLNYPELADAYASLVAMLERLPLDRQDSELYVETLSALQVEARRYARECGTSGRTHAVTECPDSGCDYLLVCDRGAEVEIDRGMRPEECVEAPFPLAPLDRVRVLRGNVRIRIATDQSNSFLLGLAWGSDIKLGPVTRLPNQPGQPASRVEFGVERGRIDLYFNEQTKVTVTGTIDGQGVLIIDVAPPRDRNHYDQVNFDFTDGDTVTVDVQAGLVSVASSKDSGIFESGESFRVDDGAIE